jgi:hypothetical protein
VEFLFQFLFEVVLQFVGEFVFGGIDKGVRHALKSRSGRFALFVLLSVLPALGIGYLWGQHVESIGQAAQPRSMWISLAVAFVLLSAAWRTSSSALPMSHSLRSLHSAGRLGHSEQTSSLAKAEKARKLRIPPVRLVMLAITNVAAAIGMAWGFNS